MRIPIQGFGGLVNRVGDAPVGTMQSGKNFVRTDKRGWLSPGLTYFKKFEDTGDNGLPQITASGGDNYLTPAINKISLLSWVDVHNFKVAEHGGKNITVAVGTYTKTGFDDPATTKARFGIWVRPYWSGAAWVDEWRELTEMFIFEIVELPGGGGLNTVVVGNAATNDFSTIDPTGKVFNNSYFIGWTIAYGDFAESENFDRVLTCDFDLISPDKYYLEIGHPNTDFAGRGVGEILWVYRNFLYKDLPASLSSHIFSLFNEIRMTSGNGVNDVSLMAGFKNDKLMVDTAALDIWRYAVVIAGSAGVELVDPLPVDTYYVKYALRMDDGNTTQLFPMLTDGGGGALTTGHSVVVGANQNISLIVLRSKGATPRRFKSLDVYISTDDVAYNLIKTFDPTEISAALFTIDAAIVHNYATFTTQGLFGAEYTNLGGSGLASLGRDVTDTGVVRWKAGTVVGVRSYVGNVYVGGVSKANQIMGGTGAGSGTMQYDVFANDGAHIIDVEYSDGDEIVAFAPLEERLLTLKRRSIVLVSPAVRGGFDRNSVSQNVGCSSVASVVVFNEVAYWIDENDRHSYSTHRGLTTLGLIANEDWLALTTAQKEAAVSVIDRVNSFWIVSAGGKQWIYDIGGEAIEGGELGDWMPFTFLDVPVAMKRDIPGTMDFITAAGKLLTINNESVNAWGFDGVNYTMDWRSNAIRVLKDKGGNAYSLLLLGIAVEYETDVPISLEVYADGTLVRTETLVTTKKKDTVYVPNGTICREFDFKLSATTDGEDAAVLIKSADAYVELRRGN